MKVLSSDAVKRRIETQIHRRQKAKAVPPMEAEWSGDSEAPSQLRMPVEKMNATGKHSQQSR